MRTTVVGGVLTGHGLGDWDRGGVVVGGVRVLKHEPADLESERLEVRQEEPVEHLPQRRHRKGGGAQVEVPELRRPREHLHSKRCEHRSFQRMRNGHGGRKAPLRPSYRQRHHGGSRARAGHCMRAARWACWPLCWTAPRLSATRAADGLHLCSGCGLWGDGAGLKLREGGLLFTMRLGLRRTASSVHSVAKMRATPGRRHAGAWKEADAGCGRALDRVRALPFARAWTIPTWSATVNACSACDDSTVLGGLTDGSRSGAQSRELSDNCGQRRCTCMKKVSGWPLSERSR